MELTTEVCDKTNIRAGTVEQNQFRKLHILNACFQYGITMSKTSDDIQYIRIVLCIIYILSCTNMKLDASKMSTNRYKL